MPTPEGFLIWGAGGHGKVVAELVRACGYRVVGFVDADLARVGRSVARARVVLHQKLFLEEVRRNSRIPGGFDAIALALGDNARRWEARGWLGARLAPSLVHPTAVVSPSARLGRMTVVLPKAVVNAEAMIEEAVIVNSGAVVEHDCEVGGGAHVSPGAVLSGGVRVGERSWIGAGATVIQGVTIGTDAVIGAGAVVLRDVPDGATVAGVPARPLRRTRSGA